MPIIPRNEPIPTPTLQSARAWPSLLQRVVVVAALLGLFSGVLTATSMTPASADWHEECNNEGCSGEEQDELWEDFQHECIVEGCWSEEVGELAGSSIYTDGTYVRPNVVSELMQYFETRTGTDVYQVAVKPGRTQGFWTDLWTKITDLLDGRVIGISCDTDGNNCGPWGE